MYAASISKKVSLKSVKKFLFFNCRKLNLTMNETNQEQLDCDIHHQYIKKIKQFIPDLTSDLHKGECGRIGVIGGSAEYTGAPYFSAISALKSGADLVYVFCCKEAAHVIKSYSPELIVLPILNETDLISKIEPWLSRLHALIVGPGLGREPGVLGNVANIIRLCNEKSRVLPLVIDADGLFLITENIDLAQEYKGPLILTPNAVEYSRLSSKFPGLSQLEIAGTLNAVILLKGHIDVIINGISHKLLHLNSNDVTIKCDINGSNRRCGGQGDILAGSLGTFVAWYHMHRQKQSTDLNRDITIEFNGNEDKHEWFKNNLMGYSLACYGASALTKTCSKFAFKEFGRSTTASDVFPYIFKAFEALFGI